MLGNLELFETGQNLWYARTQSAVIPLNNIERAVLGLYSNEQREVPEQEVNRAIRGVEPETKLSASLYIGNLRDKFAKRHLLAPLVREGVANHNCMWMLGDWVESIIEVEQDVVTGSIVRIDRSEVGIVAHVDNQTTVRLNETQAAVLGIFGRLTRILRDSDMNRVVKGAGPYYKASKAIELVGRKFTRRGLNLPIVREENRRRGSYYILADWIGEVIDEPTLYERDLMGKSG